MRTFATLLLLAALAGSAAAQGTTETRTQQGRTFAVTFRSLTGTVSACAIAPTGTTCTGGLNYAAGSLRSVTIQNIGAASTWCDETSPAVASEGFLLAASGGTYTFDKSVRRIALYCISTVGSTIAVITEKD